VIFTAQQTLEDAQAFYASVKGRMAKYGRRPVDLLVMPGVFPIIGSTQEEAERKYKVLQDLVQPAQGLQMLRNIAPGVDLSKLDLDGPLPDDLPETNGGKSRQALLRNIAARENLTIRQLFLKVAGGRGHLTLIGTPQMIADTMEQWFKESAADGFNIMPPYLPGGLEDFISLVLPELRRRGLFRTEYEGRTLRENLGLARPENQFAVNVHGVTANA
jgi:alkanesulfonate monooxygenase